MSLIYEPRGKAREYSPRALNYFNGCSYGCRYCYVPQALFSSLEERTAGTELKKSFSINTLINEAKAMQGTSVPVFLSFTHDAYPLFDKEKAVTRDVLKVLLDYDIPVIILSKGGLLWERDLDLFQKFGERIKLGQSLTFFHEDKGRAHEPFGASPSERRTALKNVHDLGLTTWASMEPVIDPSETLASIAATMDYIDEYRIGKISGTTPEYREIEKRTDWVKFVDSATTLIRGKGKRLYIKNELAALCPEGMLRPDETTLALFDSFCGERKNRTLF